MITRTATPKPSARNPGVLRFIGLALQVVFVPNKKNAKKVKPGPKPNTKPNERAFRRAVRSFPCCPIIDPRTSENISPRTKIKPKVAAPNGCKVQLQLYHTPRSHTPPPASHVHVQYARLHLTSIKNSTWYQARTPLRHSRKGSACLKGRPNF